MAAFVPLVLATVSQGSLRTYRSALRLFSEGWAVPAADAAEALGIARGLGLDVPADPDVLAACGPRPAVAPPANRTHPAAPATGTHRLVYPGCGAKPVEAVGEIDVLVACKWARARAQLSHRRRARSRAAAGRYVADRDGRGAVENLISALRLFFRLAGSEPGIALSKADNPAGDVKKPARAEPTRRMLTDEELAASWDATRLGGDDPDLDAMLYRLHVTAGARREGALNLRLRDLDEARGLLRLDEKHSKVRRKPVPVSLVADLAAFVHRYQVAASFRAPVEAAPARSCAEPPRLGRRRGPAPALPRLARMETVWIVWRHGLASGRVGTTIIANVRSADGPPRGCVWLAWRRWEGVE